MTWLRFDDDWNQRPEIRALDDPDYRAFVCSIEAAERFDCAGIVTDDHVMTVYPHDSRRKLRERIRKLVELGLFHRLQSIDDHRPDCRACKARMTEAGAEAVQKHVQNHPHSVATSARSGRTEVMVICISSFFDHARTPEKKREKRHKDAERQQRKRYRDKADTSRRDAEPPSHPPDPVPGPGSEDNDHEASKEREPTATANPSTPSNGAADRDPASWLRGEWEERQQKQPKPREWKPEYQPHIDSIVQTASEAEGDTRAIMTAALDALFADPDQQKHGCIPKALDWYWDRFAGPYLQKVEAAESQRKAEAAERRHQEAKRRAEERHAREVAERAQQRNGSKDGRGGTPVALAELMRSIDLKVD